MVGNNPGGAPKSSRLLSTISTGQMLVLVLLLIIGFQVLYPLGMLFFGSLRDAPPGLPANFTLEGYSGAYSSSATYVLLWRTLWLAIVRTVIAAGVAVFLAWAIVRTNIPWRRFLESAIVFLWFMPLIPKMLAWILLLQPKAGLLNQFLATILPLKDQGPFNIYSYGGIIFVGSLLWIPLLFIVLVPAFRSMDASLEESSAMSGASVWTTIWRIDVPLLTPAVMAATALAFIRMLESFTPEVMMGTRANIYLFTTIIYRHMSAEPANYQAAMALAVTLLLITFILVFLQRRVLAKREFTTVTGKGFRVRSVDLGKWKYVVFAGVLLFIVMDLVVPMGVLIWGSFMKVAGIFMPDMYTLAHYKAAFTTAKLTRILWNTVVMAGSAATAGMILCSLVGYVVVKTHFKMRGALDFITWIPWAVPSIVMALGFLWAYIYLPLPFGISLYGTLALMTMAVAVKGLPLGSRTMTSTLVQLSNELEESSRVHGASWLQSFTRVVLPLVAPGFIAGWILLFCTAIKDLATVLILYSPRSAVLSTVMFSKWATGQLEVAIVIGIVETALIAVVNLALTRVTRQLAGKGVK